MKVRNKKAVKAAVVKLFGYQEVPTKGLEGRHPSCRTRIFKKRWTLPPLAERA